MSTTPHTIAILGRQPALGIAELESLYGAVRIKPFGTHACLLDNVEVNFSRLGGSMRLGKILTILPNSWSEIEKFLVEKSPEYADYVSGKLSFGISVYGVQVSPRKLAKTALAVKKSIRASGHSVRMVPHDALELNSATVIHNKLTGQSGWELLVVSDGTITYLAQTTHIQDIESYTRRDRERPYRDAKVGMLPPKLAQIILNLATGQYGNGAYHRTSDGEQDRIGAEGSSAMSGTKSTVSEQRKQQDDSSRANPLLVLDPFCGTGVLLQEAMLMNFDIYGSDLDPRMVQYSIDNLSWLDTLYPDSGDYRRIEIGDATTHTWHSSSSIAAVACETYLGKPLSSLPPSDQLAKIMQEVNALHHKFLKNISSQLKSGTRLCLAVPTWRGKHEFLHLSALDFLSDLGYNRVKFTHVDDKDLIYHREGQVVGRELLVIQKR